MADIAHVEDVTQLAADGAEHGSDSGEDVPALVAPAAAAEAANEDDTGSNMGSNVGSNAGSDREDDALLGGGGADEDDDGPSVDEEIARALEATGTVEVFTTALPAMCYLLGVTYLTMALLGYSSATRSSKLAALGPTSPSPAVRRACRRPPRTPTCCWARV